MSDSLDSLDKDTSVEQPLSPEAQRPDGAAAVEAAAGAEVAAAAEASEVKAAPGAEESYDTGSIKVLRGLEAVRKRPGMYIGDTDDGSGLHHMVFEAVDNSIDEALAGFCTHIEVVIHTDGSVSCTDNGRGIPVAMHPEEQRSAAEVVMTMLHAGGKFESNSYKVSGGLHGVGISVVNALSSRLELTIRREGHVWQQVYLNGGNPEAPLHPIGDLAPGQETGTCVRFWPDPAVFKITRFEYEQLATRLRELSFLNAGVSITLEDERTSLNADGSSAPPRREVFRHDGGISEFVAYLNRGKEAIHQSVVHFNRTGENYINVEVGLQWTTGYNESVYCFTNNVPQKDGGTHVAGFRRALTNCFNNYLAQDGLAKKYKVVTTGDDARQGLTAVVSVKMPDPKFSSQTKDKLVSSEVTPVVATAVGEALNTFLQENPKDAAAICEKIVQSAREREAVRKARELSRGRKGLELNTIPDKLVSCRSKDPSICELFLVEGDSAGGSAKNGRDSNFQAVLPLRGKILNVEKAGFHRVIQSQQIGTLVTALGCGIGQDDYDPEKFRYHKVIIMTDADVDGAHIRILLLTFFFRQMPELIERGYVYVAQPPLYKYQRKKDIQYVLNDEEALQFNTNQALEFGTVHPDEGAPALPRAHLEELFKLYNRVIRSNSQLLKKYDSELIVRLLREPLFSEEQTADEEGMRAWTEHLVGEMPANPTEGLTFRGELSHDLIKQRYYPVIVKHHHGIDYRYELGEAFLGSEEFSLIRRTNEALKGLLGPGAFIAVGNRVKKVSHFHDVYTYLMQESIKGWSVQRYKGLGEMNPEQLSETTMSPDTRLLLKVEPHLAMQADLLFTQLMGDDVEYRRDYIQQHSEEAMLDI